MVVDCIGDGVSAVSEIDGLVLDLMTKWTVRCESGVVAIGVVFGMTALTWF